MQIASSDNSPEHSDQVSLEVELLKSSSRDDTAGHVTLVVASDADVRAYVSDSLRKLLPPNVIAVGSIASALDEASRCTPRLVVVSHAERAVLRHLPAVPAVLLSDDVPAAESMGSRLAPLVILRGAFGIQRLFDVATSLLAWDRENVSHVAGAITHVASVKRQPD
jgi:hypothetical protein